MKSEQELEQPSVEPVAWLIRIGDAPHWSYCETESDADFYGKQSGMRYEKKPLFTAPQAQQPQLLTDDEIDNCDETARISFRHSQSRIRGQQLMPSDAFEWHFARAVETAVLKKNGAMGGKQ